MMNNEIVFFLILVGLALIQLIGNLKLKGKQFSLWRILFFISGLVGLYLIVFPFKTSTLAPERKAIISSLDSTYMTEKDYHLYKSKRHFFQDTSNFNFTELIIRDSFFTVADQFQLESFNPKWNITDSLSGITSINCGLTIEGKPINFSGTVSKSIDHLLVIPPTGKILNVRSHNGAFKVEIPPMIAGNHLIQLQCITSQDTIVEHYPINVSKVSPSKNLMIFKNAGFEGNSLKNYLVNQGQQLAYRVQVSKDRFLTQFSSLPETNLNALTPKILNTYDTFILDVGSWNSLKPIPRNRIINNVKNGKSLLLLPSDENTEIKGIPYLKYINLNLKERNTFNTYNVSKSSTYKPIEHNKTDIAYEAYLGAGKLVVSSLGPTHTLVLQGKEQLYNQLWTEVFQSLQLEFKDSGQIYSGFPLVEGTLAQIQYFSENTTPLTLTNRRVQLAKSYAANPELLNINTIILSGWNTISFRDGQKGYYYGSKTSEWKALRQARQMAVFNYQFPDDVDRDPTVYIEKPMSKWIGYLLLLLSWAFVWWHEKKYA